MSTCRISGIQPFRLSAPPPPKKKSLGGRKLSEMSLQEPKLPIPQCLLQVAQLLSAAWVVIANRIQDVWDYVCVWILALATLYHFTDEHRSNLLEWVRSKAPGCSVSDFSNSWKNGIALVALVENLVPKVCSCPQYHLLNPKHSIQNAELAFSMAKKNLGIYPLFSAIDLASGGSPAAEKKLILYVTMLKMAAARKQKRLQKEQSQPAEAIEDPIFRNQPCLAKGMGLTLAVKGRQACFNIYLKQNDYMDIMIEIRGPSNDFVSRRITNRSPHHTLDMQWPGHNDKTNNSSNNTQSKAHMNIILEYEIIGRKVSVSYIPQSAGQHQLSIFWKGYHVEGSPFHVRVDDSSNSPEELSQKLHLAPNAFPTQKTICSTTKNNEMHKAGRIIRRRILRKVIVQNGQETELPDDESPNNDDLNWFQGNKKITETKPARNHLMMRRKAVSQNPYGNSSIKQNSHPIPRINIDCMPTIVETSCSTESQGESEFWKNLHTPSRKSSSNLSNEEPSLNENSCKYLTASLNKYLDSISTKLNESNMISVSNRNNVEESFENKINPKRNDLKHTQKLFIPENSVEKQVVDQADQARAPRIKSDLNKSELQNKVNDVLPNQGISNLKKIKFGDAVSNSQICDSTVSCVNETCNMNSRNDTIEKPPHEIKNVETRTSSNQTNTHTNNSQQSNELMSLPKSISGQNTNTKELESEIHSQIGLYASESEKSITTRSLVKSKILQWENSLF